MKVHAGELIDSRYEVIDSIGSGGFGSVFKARHVQLGRLVALKMLNAECTNGAEEIARFEREAQLISALHHRNLVLFYGYGVWNDAPYMVMEFIDGKSLEHLLLKGPLPLSRFFHITKQICDALACAHKNGVVHRDLKPSNIMIIENEQEKDLVKLIDFGLAKVLSSFAPNSQKLTAEGFAVGSVFYMSPEQCMGAAIDSRTDIYSLACTMHATLTGTSPFHAEDSVIVMNNHINEPPKPLSECQPDVDFPSGLQNILNKALAKDPLDRYQIVEELKRDLELVEQGRTQDISARHAVTPAGQYRSHSSKILYSVGAATALVLLVLFCIRNNSTYDKAPSTAGKRSSELFIEARDNWDKALRKSKNPAIMAQKWEAVVESDKIDHVLHPFQRAYAYQRVATLSFADGDNDKAIAFACQALDNRVQSSTIRNNDTYSTIRELAEACHATVQPQRALPYCQRSESIENDFCSPSALEHGWTGVMLNYLDCGRLPDALKVAKRLHWNPIDKEAKRMQDLVYGEQAYLNSDYKKAEGLFKNAFFLRYGGDRACTDLCRTYIAAGNFDPVALDKQLFAQIQTKCVPKEQCYLLRAMLAIDAGNWNLAEEQMDEATAALQKQPQLYTMAGFNYDIPRLSELLRSKKRTARANQFDQIANRLNKQFSQNESPGHAEQ